MLTSLRVAQIAPLVYPTPPVGYGGIERVLAHLIEELINKGHKVTLFGTGDSSSNAHLYSVVKESLAARSSRRLVRRHDHYHNAATAIALAHAAEFDVIHSHVGCRSIPFDILVETPVLHTLHNVLDVDDYWSLDAFPASQVNAVSRDQIMRLSADVRSRIPVIHHGTPIRQGAGQPTRHKRFLLFIGRMAREKNPVDAILVARQAKVPLVLAGAPSAWDEEERRYFRREVRPLIDGRQVTYVGPVGEGGRERLLAESIALLFPVAWREPFGLVMIEAMAAGVPVLAYPNGAVTEIVDVGLTGFVETSVEELAARVPDAARLNGARVRAHAVSRFSSNRMATEYLELYRGLVARRSRC